MNVAETFKCRLEALEKKVDRFFKLDSKTGNHILRGSLTKEEYEEFVKLYQELKGLKN